MILNFICNFRSTSLPISNKILNKLRNNRSPGITDIRVEDIKNWYEKARDPTGKLAQKGYTPDDFPDAVKAWEKVVELVQLAWDGQLPRVFSYSIFVLIPKDTTATKMRGIALQETIYKLIAMVINLRIRAKIVFDDCLHSFISKRGTGTAIMDLKLLMQRHSQSLDPLHVIFLDLTKAYDSVHRGRVLKILKKYGVGKKTLRIFRHYWKHNKLFPKQYGYFGHKIRARRGIPQGDNV